MSRPSWSIRIYAVLLRLYPTAFRREYGPEMRRLFVERLTDERGLAGRGTFRFWCRITVDLFTSAVPERWIALREWLGARLVPQPTPPDPRVAGDSMLETLVQDIRYSLRMLRKTPTFTIVAIVVIALGSGAVTTIFSAANALLLRPIPGVSDPGRLVTISRSELGPGGGAAQSVSYPLFTDLAKGTRTMTGVAAWSVTQLTISNGGQGTSAFAAMVSGTYFPVLGVHPELGRFFTADYDHEPGAHAEIVLGDGFWRRRFGGDSSIVGRSVLVNGSPYTVIGIAPANFSGVMPLVQTDAWVPLAMSDQLGRGTGLLTNYHAAWLMLFGRLKPGMTAAQAHGDVMSIVRPLAQNGVIDKDTGLDISALTGVPQEGRRMLTGFMALLAAIALLVLVIASVNVASMLLARGAARRRELAVRIALGARRARVVRQLVTESVILFLGGALGGFAIAFWSTRLVSTIRLPVPIPVTADFTPDYGVLLATLGVALLTGVLFGLAPAFDAARGDPSVALRSDSAGAGQRRSRLRNGLVVGQLAISLLLLMSAGLFMRALAKGLTMPTGFATDHVATAAFALNSSGYDQPRATTFYDQLERRLLATPGVTGVAFVAPVPLTGSTVSDEFSIEGYVPDHPEGPNGMVGVDIATVSPGYFNVVRLPLLAGRDFARTDDAAATHVAIVNESFAKTYWPGTDPIGRTFVHQGPFFPTPVTFTVVGVARDAKYSSLGESPHPFVYLPLAQNWEWNTTMLVRTSGAPEALTAPIRDAVRGLDPLLPSPAVVTLDAATSVVLLPERIAAFVTGAMGLLGLVLAAVGLYGVVSYTVSQRTREIGVRMALGADRARVLGMVVRDGMRLVAIGVVIGMVLAVAGTRVMRGFLFGVSPLDPLVFAVIPIGLALVTLLASYLPARRAAATDPVAALRDG
jgi:putative ABC transport system permease protein